VSKAPQTTEVEKYKINILLYNTTAACCYYYYYLLLANTLIKTIIFWDVSPFSLVEVYRRFRVACCLHHQGDEAANTSETSVNLYETTRHNIPEDSHLHTLRGEKLKSHSNKGIEMLLLKYLRIVVRLLRGFNNIEFPRDLTSRPGFATGVSPIYYRVQQSRIPSCNYHIIKT
jgi:hypothetical protein